MRQSYLAPLRFATILAFLLLPIFMLLIGQAEAQITPQIIGGTDAPWGKYPFAVSLQSDEDGPLSHFCTGTLIAPQWVLSAAHCVGVHSVARTYAVIGTPDLSLSSQYLYNIERVVAHPGYAGTHMQDDIALFKLTTPAYVPVVNIVPANLSSSLYDGRPVDIIGWGHTGYVATPTTLQEGQIGIQNQIDCANYWNAAIGISGNQICGGSPYGTRTCYGDSGGPMLHSEGGRYFEVGITSFGAQGCPGMSYTVFTRAGNYRDWIAQQIGTGDTVRPEIDTAGISGTKFGTVSVSANVVDNILFQRAIFKVDSTVVKEFTSFPLSHNLDTNAFLDGSHQFTIIGLDYAGNQHSRTFPFSIQNGPRIDTQPANGDAVIGGTVTFKVIASGPSLSFQWKRNGANIAGATSSSLTLSNITAADDGALFSVVVSNSKGSVTSTSASLTLVSLPVITSHPQSVTGNQGSPVTLAVAATGKMLRYEWHENGVGIPGATSATYTISALTAAHSGKQYRCTVTNAAGAAVSNSATVTVLLPVSIQSVPQSVTVMEGQTASFSVAATGTSLSYQWKRNGVPIPGATASSYSFVTTLADKGSRFSVTITSAIDSKTTAEAILTVEPLVRIDQQPVTQIIPAGKPVTFSVSATGVSLKYQWYRNGVAIANAINTSYTFTSAATLNGSSYTVVVSGPGNSVTSSAAQLIVPTAITITAQPLKRTVADGSTVSFSVTATGNPLNYQWKRNGVAIPAATSSTYSLTAALADSGASYSVVVSNPLTTVASTAAVLTVVTPASINTQPAAQIATAGKPVTFSVAAAGSSLTYQWYRNGSALTGATLAYYTFTPTTAHNAVRFSVVVKGPVNSVTSNEALLTVYTAAAITTQPVKKTVTEGQSVSFSVVATGSQLSYQWNRNGAAIAGATAATYSFATSAADSGASFTVTVSSPVNSVTSAAAVLTVQSPAVILTQPASQTVVAGTPVSFSVTATGTSLTYQWYKNGVLLTGYTAATLTVTPTAAANNAKYHVVVKSPINSVTSAIAVLTVESPAAITTQPVRKTVNAGQTASFSVVATGNPLSYQWKRNGIAIAGATAASYAFVTQASDNGAVFSVTVKSNLNEVTSSAVPLTVQSAAVIVTQPASQTITAGTPVTFSVTATGFPLTYQWYKAGVAISGATGSSYSFTAALAHNNARYSVIVKSPLNSVTSTTATLTVK